MVWHPGGDTDENCNDSVDTLSGNVQSLDDKLKPYGFSQNASKMTCLPVLAGTGSLRNPRLLQAARQRCGLSGKVALSLSNSSL